MAKNKRKRTGKTTRSTASRIKRAAIVLVSLGCLGLFFLVGAFFYFKAGLPSIKSLNDYEPMEVSKIYSDDGKLIGELFEERRTHVSAKDIPQHVKHAFLAAEDAAFYEHEGLDYFGIVRAVIKNMRPGAHRQGASTITQQTVKTLVVGDERSYTRKIREAILTRELEQMLSKDDILELYLNQIFFGDRAYGVEEASQRYFGKSVRKVTLGEAAYLACAPKSPRRYTIRRSPAAVKKRQIYVLKNMEEHGWAQSEDVAKAIKARVPLPAPRPKYLGKVPHYVEHVKSLLVEEFGEEMVMKGGMKVYTGLHAESQVAAQNGLKLGLEELAQRHGYPGAALRVEADLYESVMEVVAKRFDGRLQRSANYYAKKQMPLHVWTLQDATKDDISDGDRLAEAMSLKRFATEERFMGIVDIIDAAGKAAYIDLGSIYAKVHMKDVKWAKSFAAYGGKKIRGPGGLFKKGDLVSVDILDEVKGQRSGKGVARATLVPRPMANGAVISIDPHSRFVRAMVGGYEQVAGKLNRALQAKRQPGSAFKPIVYGTAIAEKVITPSSLCADTPVTIIDPWTGKAWKPDNYNHKHDGNITFRIALTKSKNTCSVKLIDKMVAKLGPDIITDSARRLGIKSHLPKNLTLALGTGEVAPVELANAYSTIAAGGLYDEPIFIRKVVDNDGKVVLEKHSEPEQVMDAAAAYVITNMMRGVVEEGTATRAKVLDRPLAGKTGTTQQSRSVWFSGFSPELVATVYIGFDNNKPLGRASGGSTALPVWIRYMGRALAGVPVVDFEIPEGVVKIWVDKATGEPTEEPADIEDPRFVHEAFIEGTQPEKKTALLASPFLIDDE